jgi:hypothetical protein
MKEKINLDLTRIRSRDPMRMKLVRYHRSKAPFGVSLFLMVLEEDINTTLFCS